MLDNAFKPYPCGIVIHPVLDACLALARERTFDAAAVVGVCVEVNPLCLTLCDRPAPANNQLAQVSVQHWTAAALTRGRAGLAEGRDECVHDPAVVAMREKVSTKANPAIARDAGVVVIEMRNGERLEKRVEHCIGSIERPMTGEELTNKFLGQAAPVLGVESASDLLERCWSIGDIPVASELVDRCATVAGAD